MNVVSTTLVSNNCFYICNIAVKKKVSPRKMEHYYLIGSLACQNVKVQTLVITDYYQASVVVILALLLLYSRRDTELAE